MLLPPEQLQRHAPHRGTGERPRQSRYQPTGCRRPSRAMKMVLAPTVTGAAGRHTGAAAAATGAAAAGATAAGVAWAATAAAASGAACPGRGATAAAIIREATWASC